jgi:serine/threonine-protein kinase
LHTAGEVLQSRYEIESVLGQGGMGGVYKGRHRALDVSVAIKEMTLEVKGESLDAAVRQFRREAQTLHQLKHPNLPRVHDFFEEDGQYYLVMDFIAGHSLEQVLQARVTSEAEVLGWAHELCSVLEYLHGYTPPIIFRDLKPSNVMLGEDGHIKLIDFGIAKDLDTRTGRGTQTSVRGAGTPGFAAPEQYGQGSDVRTDVYALGATLYSLLTRMMPPDSVDIASGAAELRPLRDIRPDVTPATAQVIEWCMTIHRGKRPTSVREVAQALDTGGPPVASVPSVTVPLPGLPAAVPTVIDMDECQRQIDEQAPRFSRWGVLALGLLVTLGVAGVVVQHHQAGPVVAHGLHIETQPAGAQVEVAGQQGTTPFNLDLAIPKAWVTISKTGYHTVREELPVPTSTSFALVPDTPAVTFAGSPVGTHVLVDGHGAGTTSADGLTLSLAVGRHGITFKKAGYVSSYMPVTVAVGGIPAPVSFRLKLDPAYGRVILKGAPAGAAIGLDGQPADFSQPVRQGPHKISIAATGFETQRRSVTVKGGQTAIVDGHLQAQTVPVATENPVVVMPAPSQPASNLTGGPGAGAGAIQAGHVGALQLGQSETSLPPGFVRAGKDKAGKGTYWNRMFKVRALISDQGTVYRVVVFNPSLTTVDGLHVGSTRAEVEQARGRGIEHRGWVVYPSDRIGFLYHDNVVDRVAILSQHFVEEGELGR